MTKQFWVYVNKSPINNGRIRLSYWKGFDNLIAAMLFMKVNGYKLIAEKK